MNVYEAVIFSSAAMLDSVTGIGVRIILYCHLWGKLYAVDPRSNEHNNS